MVVTQYGRKKEHGGEVLIDDHEAMGATRERSISTALPSTLTHASAQCAVPSKRMGSWILRRIGTKRYVQCWWHVCSFGKNSNGNSVDNSLDT